MEQHRETKERPILFGEPMVRAILDGRKTQTRRVVKPRDLAWMDEHQGLREDCNALRCPYGQSGDRLWVREAWRTYSVLDNCKPSGIRSGAGVQYEAGGSNIAGIGRLEAMGRFRPGMFMPRWASRILLEIVGVRVERLHDISEENAIAEGANPSIVGSSLDHLKFRAGFESLWESINGRASWEANPFVWVIEFRRAA